MALDSIKIDQTGSCWATIAALVQADGSAQHSTPLAMAHVRTPARMIADSVHLIGMLHGRHPGIIDNAAARAPDAASSAWLVAAADAFAGERSYLARLVAVAGPLPSTPCQAESETAVAAQRHALDMLARSDRQGCAVGAAVAVLLDWRAIRTVLDAASARLGLDVPACGVPGVQATAAMVSALSGNPSVERAMAFGAQQVLNQHRGLWDLIEARASARGDI